MSTNIVQKQATIDYRLLSIDSIVVYTAVFVKTMYYSPYNRYQDSLYCNYDTLKYNATKLKRIYSTNRNKQLIDSIENLLRKIKPIKKILKDSSRGELRTVGIKNCQFDYEISDLFVVYTGKRTIRIGSVVGSKRFCNIEGVFYKTPRGNNLIQLLYRYRELGIINKDQ